MTCYPFHRKHTGHLSEPGLDQSFPFNNTNTSLLPLMDKLTIVHTLTCDFRFYQSKETTLIYHTSKRKPHYYFDFLYSSFPHIKHDNAIDIRALISCNNPCSNSINETDHEQTIITQWMHPLLPLFHLTTFSTTPFLLLLIYIVINGIIMNLTTRKNNYILVPMLVQFLMHHLVHLTALKTYHSLLIPLVQFLVHLLVHFIVLTTSYSRSLYKLLKTTDISGLLSDYTNNFLHFIYRHSLIVVRQQYVNTGNNEQYNHSIPISFKEAMNGPDAAGFMIAMNKEIRTDPG